MPAAIPCAKGCSFGFTRPTAGTASNPFRRCRLQLDPNIPANLSPEQLRDFKSFLDVALDGLSAAAGGEVFATGNALFGGLALIVVVLNGLKIAFSGNIQPWELVRVVIGLWIPWVMLQFYTTTIPGMAFTFPGMIAAGGNWLHQLLIGDAVYAMQTELGNLIRSLAANQAAQAQQGNTSAYSPPGFMPR